MFFGYDSDAGDADYDSDASQIAENRYINAMYDEMGQYAEYLANHPEEKANDAEVDDELDLKDLQAALDAEDFVDEDYDEEPEIDYDDYWEDQDQSERDFYPEEYSDDELEIDRMQNEIFLEGLVDDDLLEDKLRIQQQQQEIDDYFDD